MRLSQAQSDALDAEIERFLDTRAAGSRKLDFKPPEGVPANYASFRVSEVNEARKNRAATVAWAACPNAGWMAHYLAEIKRPGRERK